MARKKTKANKGVPHKKVAASVARTAELPGESPVVNPWPKGYRSACLFTFDVDTEVSWVFRDVDVSDAKDPSNRYYFAVQVDGVQTYPTIWGYGAEKSTTNPPKALSVLSRHPPASSCAAENAAGDLPPPSPPWLTGSKPRTADLFGPW